VADQGHVADGQHQGQNRNPYLNSLAHGHILKQIALADSF
jgi:hypothetical protein